MVYDEEAQVEAIGVYEFALVPRSMFAPDGTMLRCSAKSALMTILEKLPPVSSSQRSDSYTMIPTAGPNLTVLIIDGMAELHCLDKPEWVKNCAQLADHFINTMEQKYGKRNEVRLIFDVIERGHKGEKARRPRPHLLSYHGSHQHLESTNEEASFPL